MTDYNDFKNPKTFIWKSDQFLEKGLQPSTEEEDNAINEMMKIYVPLDEERIAEIRQKLRDEHERETNARGPSGKTFDPEAASRRIEAEIERKRKEAEEARLAKIRAEELRKRVAEYKKKLAADTVALQVEFADSILNFKYHALEKMLKDAIKETERAAKDSPDERKLAENFVKRPKEYQKMLANCLKLYNALLNNGTKLKNRQIELPPRKLMSIVEVKDRKITLKDLASGEIITMPVNDLRERYYQKYVKKALTNFSMPDQKFYSLVVNGELGPEIVPVTPSGYWRRELPQIKYNYIRESYRKADASGRAELKKRYGDWKDFDRAVKGIK